MLYYGLCTLMVALLIMANIKYGKRTPNLNRHTITWEKLFLFFVFFSVFLVLTLESVETNNDMLNYQNVYYRYRNSSMDIALKNFILGKDPVYHILAYLFMKLGFDFYTWHMCLGILYAVSMYKLINTYSANIYISIMCVFVLGQFNFVLGGVRQAIALSILVNSFGLLRKKQFLKFVLLVLGASLFHSTAIVFVLVYPIWRMSLRLRNLFIILVLGAVFVWQAPLFMRLYLTFFSNTDIYESYFERETTLSASGMIISACISVFCIVFTFLDKKNEENSGLCYLSVISFYLRLLSTFMFAEMFRLALYFSVFDCILIAEACANGRDRYLRQFKTMGVSLALSAYCFIMPPATYIASYVIR